ncbi:MAG: Holliday junction resolvase RuvX [Candidatus Pacebacteria bacterium]|nr:Holliday junction resolvase RuvX [Candidatus Paceibacterota bacterium]MCD8507839.1 Holliday junction resolvase RuvX [Candidatus Paceibacterota bacterium]MCD8527844.1 Holliday junction resolvase RuvX [Candidatus Paceibacterota bacterium]MCD8563518.1 Holliday junction resolvase RuvX [Candidatus Paceibacterota bacterium]
MPYLGIDFGTKRIGLAIADRAVGIAFPLTVLAMSPSLIQEIQDIVTDRAIEKIILGDTKNMYGKDNAVTAALHTFKTKLEQSIAIPVIMQGEQLTSHEASRLGGFGGFEKRHQANQRGREKKTGDIDASAAALILQRYLDTHYS